MITECAAYDLIDRLHSPDLTRLQKRTANCQCLTTKEPQDGRLSGQRDGDGLMAIATDKAAAHHDQGDGNRHNGLLAHNLASQYCGRFSNSGSLATLMAMRRASSRVIRFRSRPASRLIFVISVSERAPVVVLHNEARAVVIDRPRWREAAAGHRQRRLRTNHEHGELAEFSTAAIV